MHGRCDGTKRELREGPNNHDAEPARGFGVTSYSDRKVCPLRVGGWRFRWLFPLLVDLVEVATFAFCIRSSTGGSCRLVVRVPRDRRRRFGRVAPLINPSARG